ncbi:MAG: hypothetical protein ACJ76H_02860 [Bacteriovoracaceae bacterium]
MDIVDIEEQLRMVKDMCREHIHELDDTEERALMTAAAEVLSGLEKAFHQCFHDDHNHVFSPKSIEPWD